MSNLCREVPFTVAAPASTGRLYFLDNLRSFIILLVVVFHASMSYMLFAPKWWYVVDTKQSLGFVPPIALLIRAMPWNIVTRFAATSVSALPVSYLASEFAISKTPPFRWA
jgi:hypothetical protein